MLPPDNSFPAAGALWYKPMVQSVICATGVPQPRGFDQGRDALNWAIVVPSAGTYIRLISDGEEIHVTNLTAGLNFGSPVGLQAGSQVLQLRKPRNSTALEVCQGGGDVLDGCGLGFYDFNYRVAGLGSGQSSTTTTSTSATRTTISSTKAPSTSAFQTSSSSAKSHSATASSSAFPSGAFPSGTFPTGIIPTIGPGNLSGTSLSDGGHYPPTLPTEGLDEQRRVVKWIPRCQPKPKD